MKTLLQIATAYLKARAASDEAREESRMTDFAYAEGQRAAYADVLELNEDTFTAPPPSVGGNGSIAFPARVTVEPAFEHGRVLVCIPRVPDEHDPSPELCWFLPTHQARELRDALAAVAWPPSPEAGGAQ